jgi:hypothetical protein
MVNQIEQGATGGSVPDLSMLNEASGGPPAHPSFHGRAVSWFAVSTIMAGFLVGGLALMLGDGGPVWWLFWTGAGLAVAGLLLSVATNTFEDWY